MLDQTFPHLSKAPIVEAAIEIRGTITLPVAEEVFDKMRDAVADHYPTHNPIQFFAPHFQIESETNIRTEASISRIGVRLESADKRIVVQAKVDGLTVSRLQPYKSWSLLIAEVRDLWSTYCKVFAPSEVTRLGVRYINRIPLEHEEGRIDLDTVFAAGPQIPPTLPQTLEQYMTRIVVPFERENATLVITQALEAPTSSGLPTALLDLDAYTNTAMPPATEAMWDQLDRLRSVKNAAFFGSLQGDIWKAFI